MRTVAGMVPRVLALLAGLAASGKGAETGPEKPAVVDLKFAAADARSFRGFAADDQGVVEIKPFANAAGRLTFRIAADSVRADTSGDGTIDDADAPAVKPERTTIHVAARNGTTDFKYPIELLFVRERMLVAGSRATMEGLWNGRLVSIGDLSMDGVFGNRGDTLAIATAREAGQNGAAARLPWSNTVGVDGRLYALALENAGKLRIEPYAGAVSELRFAMAPAPADAQLQVTGEAGAFCATARSIAEPIRAIPGALRITGTFGWEGGATKMYLRGFPKPVVLGAEPLTLKIGPPLAVAFDATRDGQDITLRNVKITGVSGENWQPAAGDKADGPAAFIRSGGREHRLATMEYG